MQPPRGLAVEQHDREQGRTSVLGYGDGATGTERWSETCDAALGDVFAIQGEIAARIAGELAAALTPAERSSSTPVRGSRT